MWLYWKCRRSGKPGRSWFGIRVAPWAKKTSLGLILLLLGLVLGLFLGDGSRENSSEATRAADFPSRGDPLPERDRPSHGSDQKHELREDAQAILLDPMAPLTIRLRQGELARGGGGWELEVMNPSNQVVRHFRGSGQVPHEIPWNGLDDGGLPVPNRHLSTYALKSLDKSGKASNSGPRRKIYTFLDSTLRHRKGDPQKGIEIEFMVRALPFNETPLRWELQVLDKDGEPVGSFEGRGLPPLSLIWDGSRYPNSPEFSYRFRAWPREGESFVIEDKFLPEGGTADPASLAAQGLLPPPPLVSPTIPPLPILP